MKQAIRPRRSILYMPGSNSRALEKARDLPVDGVIFDLEDAVAPEMKVTAREQVIRATTQDYGKREVIIRVNGLDTDWGQDDLRAAATASADAILLPKIETAASVTQATEILTAAGAPADLPIWIMTETPRGVLDLDSILADQPRIAAVVMGTTDLAKELRISPDESRMGLIHALSHCVLAARAHELDIIDGVHLALDDAEGFRAACKQGRNLGFDGKSLIHPRQIEAANSCFGVTDDEAELAREILAAWQTARRNNSGVAVVRGKLIEQLHVAEAERLLTLHEASSGQR